MSPETRKFKLHPQLAADCHLLGRMDCSRLLLMDNIAVPWLILVPEVEATEFHELIPDIQRRVLNEINALSVFLKSHIGVDKINLGAIGNKVPQLHIHVVGRFESDVYWPGVVWGASPGPNYGVQTVEDFRRDLAAEVPLFSSGGE